MPIRQEISIAKGYTSGNIEMDLHEIISNEAKRNKISFSAQIREYRDHVFALEKQLDDAREEIKNLKRIYTEAI